jgi:hypothetical protein
MRATECPDPEIHLAWDSRSTSPEHDGVAMVVHTIELTRIAADPMAIKSSNSATKKSLPPVCSTSVPRTADPDNGDPGLADDWDPPRDAIIPSAV